MRRFTLSFPRVWICCWSTSSRTPHTAYPLKRLFLTSTLPVDSPFRLGIFGTLWKLSGTSRKILECFLSGFTRGVLALINGLTPSLSWTIFCVTCAVCKAKHYYYCPYIYWCKLCWAPQQNSLANLLTLSFLSHLLFYPISIILTGSTCADIYTLLNVTPYPIIFCVCSQTWTISFIFVYNETFCWLLWRNRTRY